MKHSLDLLKYALDYSEAIVDTVRLPLIVLNKKQQVLTANRSFYETFMLTPVETENRLIYELNEGAWNLPKLKLLLEKILPANSNFDNYEVEIELPHLGLRTIVLNARRTYRQVNNTEAILLAMEDITARKQLEKQKDDFIGIISHELKTPLTTIRLYSQVLEKYLGATKDRKALSYLLRMKSQIERLTQLMASFTNVYKIQNGKLELEKRSFDIDELIGEVVADFQFTTKSHAIKHKTGIKTVVCADYERITQVLVNLISNAVKYSPGAKKVIVTLRQDETKVIVSVQDFGLGIGRAEQAKVFDRFYRVRGKRDKNIPGLGLGLYISSEIIKRHKGKIWVESVEGKGSTFYFSLPVAQYN